MTELNNSNKSYGLSVGTKAPLFETIDVNKNEVKLFDLLQKHRGVLLDFFRGNW